MIGIDTNVLLRLLLRDDPVQHEFAQRVTEKGPILLADVVLVELVWTLTRKFSWSKAQLVDMLDRLLSQSAFVFADRSVVMHATRSFESGKAGFADYMIGAANERAGATTTSTFDQDAGRHRWFTLIGPQG